MSRLLSCWIFPTNIWQTVKEINIYFTFLLYYFNLIYKACWNWIILFLSNMHFLNRVSLWSWLEHRPAVKCGVSGQGSWRSAPHCARQPGGSWAFTSLLPCLALTHCAIQISDLYSPCSGHPTIVRLSSFEKPSGFFGASKSALFAFVPVSKILQANWDKRIWSMPKRVFLLITIFITTLSLFLSLHFWLFVLQYSVLTILIYPNTP